ncbi:MAG: C40 family peptidase [Bacteroidetes bacterium]|nr:C40 family peptidase [Bacteroidota bacterium]
MQAGSQIGTKSVSDSIMLSSKDSFIEKPVFRNNKTKTDSILNYAFSFLGKRYKRGGIGKKGFDCSGYTMVVFSKFGLKLPHTSAGQGLIGIEVPKNNAKKGDLILFKGRRSNKRIGHVGIIISNKGEPIKFVHSSTSEGVRIDALDGDYYRKRYVRIKRILY